MSSGVCFQTLVRLLGKLKVATVFPLKSICLSALGLHSNAGRKISRRRRLIPPLPSQDRTVSDSPKNAPYLWGVRRGRRPFALLNGWIDAEILTVFQFRPNCCNAMMAARSTGLKSNVSKENSTIVWTESTVQCTSHTVQIVFEKKICYRAQDSRLSQ